jgi:hypothetical protein
MEHDSSSSESHFIPISGQFLSAQKGQSCILLSKKYANRHSESVWAQAFTVHLAEKPHESLKIPD